MVIYCPYMSTFPELHPWNKTVKCDQGKKQTTEMASH